MKSPEPIDQRNGIGLDLDDSEEEDNMTIGERVIVLVKERDMAQKEVSIRTGIPQSTISDGKCACHLCGVVTVITES